MFVLAADASRQKAFEVSSYPRRSPSTCAMTRYGLLTMRYSSSIILGVYLVIFGLGKILLPEDAKSLLTQEQLRVCLVRNPFPYALETAPPLVYSMRRRKRDSIPMFILW